MDVPSRRDMGLAGRHSTRGQLRNVRHPTLGPDWGLGSGTEGRAGPMAPARSTQDSMPTPPLLPTHSHIRVGSCYLFSGLFWTICLGALPSDSIPVHLP